MHLAAEKGHTPVIQALAGLRASIATTGNEGQQPVHVAATHGHVDVVEQLGQLGAYVAAADEEYKQPMHYAALGGHVHLVEFLVKHGKCVSGTCRWRAAHAHGSPQWSHRCHSGIGQSWRWRYAEAAWKYASNAC